MKTLAQTQPEGIPVSRKLKSRVENFSPRAWRSYTSNSGEIRKLKSSIAIAKSMIELHVPSSASQPHHPDDSGSPPLMHKARIPTSLADLSDKELCIAWRVLSDREKALEQLEGKVYSQTLATLRGIPRVPALTLRVLTPTAFGAAVFSPVGSGLAFETSLPWWGKALVGLGGLVAGAAAVLGFTWKRLRAKARKANERMDELDTILKSIETNAGEHIKEYGQGVHGLIARLSFILPESDKRDSLKRLEFSEGVLTRQYVH